MNEPELAPRVARHLSEDDAKRVESQAVEPEVPSNRRKGFFRHSTQPVHSPTAGEVKGSVTEQPVPAIRSFGLGVPPERLFARFAVGVGGKLAWLTTCDEGRSLLFRYTSHVVILAVLLSVIGFVGTAKATEVSAPSNRSSIKRVVNTVSLAAPSANGEENYVLLGQGGPIVVDQIVLSPQANPYTAIPSRERRGVISYTVQAGDTLFGIAAQFSLRPESVLWANYDTLEDNPHLLKTDMELAIPPINGIVYTVAEGDTVESIAETYKVTPDAIYTDGFEWNQLRPGEQPYAGQSLIIPGGSREFKAWAISAAENTPQPSANTGSDSSSSSGVVVARGNVGACSGAAVGSVVGSGTFIWPAPKHWVGGNNYAGWHPGIDLAANLGDPISAADSGVVVWAGWNNWGYGNLVVIDHGNGWQTYYAHNSEIYVSCGQGVNQGAVIAAAGSTGRSTGPHLHFETRFQGTIPNPFSVLPPP